MIEELKEGDLVQHSMRGLGRILSLYPQQRKALCRWKEHDGPDGNLPQTSIVNLAALKKNGEN